MSIRKRPSKSGYVWEFCITIQKRPRKQYRKGGFKTKLEAQKAEAIALNKFCAGQNLKAEETDFIVIADKLLEHTQKTKASATYRNYKNSMKHLEYFHYMKIKDINSLIIENWIIKSDKTNSTIRECIKFGKAVFNYAIKHRLTNYNPFKYVDVPKTEKPKHIRLLIPEAKEMLELCRDIYNDFYPILTLAIFTGMREGEILGLKWKDIDFKNGLAEVQRQFTNNELKTMLKTSSSYRKVDLSNKVMNVLKDHKRNCKILSEFVFTNQAGNLHNSRNLMNRRFKKLLEIMFKDKNYMRFHDLRGTYVDILLSKGVPLKYIQKQLGHANFLTTMNSYSELIRDVNDHAVNVLDEVLKEIG